MNHKKINEVKRSIFDSERMFWRMLSRFMDWVYLSILWVVCSVPIITIGAATTALYSAAYHCLLQKDDTILSRFFDTFKSEFRQSTVTWLFWASILGLYAVLWVFIVSLGDSAIVFALTVSAFAMTFLACGALVWVFALLARFHFSWYWLNVTAVRFVLAHTIATVLMLVSLVLCMLACWIWMFPLMVFPGALAHLDCLIIERFFCRMDS